MQGTRTKWTGNQLMTTKSFEINYYKDKDFKTVNLHSHDFYELYFFVHGDASYLIENGHYNLQAGDIMLISPQNLHQLDIHDSKAMYERYVLWISPKYLKRLSTNKTDLTKCFEISNSNKDFLIRDVVFSDNIKERLKRLYELQGMQSFGLDLWSEILIKEILLLLNNYKLNNIQIKDNRKVSINQTVSKTIEYIEEHISEDLSLDTIANNLFVSKFYLSRLFKDETNSTLHQYILKKRLVLSKQLIEQGLPIINVYQKCGFTDYSNFFRIFKNEFGITPKQYYSLIKN